MIWRWGWWPWGPTRTFPTSACPFLLWKVGVLFLSWVPCLSGFLNVDTINYYALLLPDYRCPIWLSARFKRSSAQLRALALQRRWQWGCCWPKQRNGHTRGLCFWLDSLWGLPREKLTCISQILSQELNTSSKQKPDQKHLFEKTKWDQGKEPTCTPPSRTNCQDFPLMKSNNNNKK